MYRLLIHGVLLFMAAPALAQNGAIVVGTPITFATPATITHWDPQFVGFWPGPNARIVIELVARGRPDVVLTFDYPRDCGSFGATDGKPNPPTCPDRDTSAEVNAAILVLNAANNSGGNTRMYQKIFNNICADFPSRFLGGCTVTP